MHTLIVSLAITAILAIPAVAGITQYDDRADFEAGGTLFDQYDFADFDPEALTEVDEPWHTHGVTYWTGTGDLLVAGAGWSGAHDNFIINNQWSPLFGALDPGHDMFAWDMNGMHDGGPVTVYIQTTEATYSYSTYAPEPPETVFMGFIADAGESITGFEIVAETNQNAPGMTHVAVGRVQVVATEAITLSAVKSLFR